MAGGYHERFRQLVEEIRPRIDTIPTKRLFEDIKRDSDQPTVIDVREHDDWQNSHIPHSLSIPKSIIERDIEYHVPNLHEKIILYSREGYLSLLAADNLKKMGYTDVYSLKGGYHAWTIAGLPMQQGGEIIYPDQIEAREDMEEFSASDSQQSENSLSD